jgi:hypothetical protein
LPLIERADARECSGLKTLHASGLCANTSHITTARHTTAARPIMQSQSARCSTGRTRSSGPFMIAP